MAHPREVGDDAIRNADRILAAFRYSTELEWNKQRALLQAERVQDAIDACGDEMLDGDMVELIERRARLLHAKEELIRYANRQEAMQMEAVRDIHAIGEAERRASQPAA